MKDGPGLTRSAAIAALRPSEYTAALIQVLQGHYDFELALYGRVLFGLQLPDYVLFALLALVVHVLVKGRIVATGGPELADELEHTGYAAYGPQTERDVTTAGTTPVAAADPFADPFA